MTEFTLSKRSFLKSLFVAPAIVAATNIMPVKAFQLFTEPASNKLIMPIGIPGPAGKLITDLETIQEASSSMTGNWQLVQIAGGERRWLTKYSAEQLKFKYDVIKTMNIPQTPREIDTTVALMREEPGSQVIWGELPAMMRR